MIQVLVEFITLLRKAAWWPSCARIAPCRGCPRWQWHISCLAQRCPSAWAQGWPQAHSTWGRAAGRSLSAQAPCPWVVSYPWTCVCPCLAQTNLQLKYSRISTFTAKPEDFVRNPFCWLGLWWVLRFQWPDTPGRGGGSACPVEVTAVTCTHWTVGAAVPCASEPSECIASVGWETEGLLLVCCVFPTSGN